MMVRLLLLIMVLISLTWSVDSIADQKMDQKFKSLQNVLDANNASNTSSVVPDIKAPSLGDIAVRMVISLGVVLLLIYVLYRLAKKVRKMDLPPSEGGKAVQMLETYHVGAQQKILLMRLGDRRVLLVGTSGDGMRTLAQLEGEEADKIIAGQTPSKTSSTQFSETVNQMLNRFRREEKT